MIFIILAVGLVAAIVEAWGDRHGETKKEKLKDGLILAILTSLSCFVAWCVAGIHPLKTALVILAVRILVFDYLVSYLLIRNGVIVGHWFTYTGKTSKWDQLISKVNPMIRLVIRVILFVGAVILFFYP